VESANARRGEIRVLGPLEVAVGDQLINPGGPRLRTLLAVLAADAGRVVSVAALADALWDESLPADAHRTTRTYMSRLRQALLPAAPDELIETHPAGYLLRPPAGMLDADRFERQATAGRRALAAGDAVAAASALTAALDLWRGGAYEEFAGVPAVAPEAARLERLRLAALADRIEADLAAGAGPALIVELTSLTEAYPGHERLWGQLMIALYRAGRQADALEAFLRARTGLIEQAGLEPSRQLVEIHQQVLAQDARLLGARAAAAPALPKPAQLPPDVPGFTGRREELDELDELLAKAVRQPTAMVISALAGTAGVGKTALAVHWAHRVADRYPDGQLYLDLRGYDPEQPMPPADALAALLDGLGITGAGIPLEVTERAARYRSAIAGRRMLVVLDNAGAVEQVRPLLPGTPTAMVIVTSRDRLSGLVAVQGARRIELDLLPAADAHDLLRELIGRRVDAEPVAAAALADACARLPLALRVAAELAASRRTASLADLVTELADRQRRLHLLDAGDDPRVAVTSVFSWSYRHLPAAAARTFRLAGLHPGPDLDAYAAAAMAGSGLADAQQSLDRLARAHLMTAGPGGRYGMHDLLRGYAAGLAAAEDGEDERRAALGRLFDYYLAVAATAIDRLHPAEAHRRPRVPAPVTPVPELDGDDAAKAWLDAERATMVAIAGYAAVHGWARHAVWLSPILYRYLAGGRDTDALIIHSHASLAAQQLGDLAGQANATIGLGVTHGQLGRWEQAAEHHRRALALYQQAGDRTGQARALGNVGAANHRLGRYRDAADYFEQARVLFQQAGDHVGLAQALDSLSRAELRLGRYEEAAEHAHQAVAVHREAGDRQGEAEALSAVADVESEAGNLQAGAELCQQAIAIYRQVGNALGEAATLTRVGDILVAQGRPEEAAVPLRLALSIYVEYGDRDGEPWAHNGLGDAALAAGRPAEALDHFTAGHTAARLTGARHQLARAHVGIGTARRVLGTPGEAREHFQQALTIYLDLGAPEADEARAKLAALDSSEISRR
jgi:DNA-binding SARP family transcriptional activator/tetratricopeptide (TPR) repeat protein